MANGRADMSKPKRYFQLIHTDEDGSKTYRIHLPPDRVRRCARCGRWVMGDKGEQP